MTPGLSGSLLSREALARVVPKALGGLLDEEGSAPARRRMREGYSSVTRSVGPTAASTSPDGPEANAIELVMS